MVYPAIILGLATWLSYTKGRLYCNTVCPVGTFLGFISKFSLFKISIDNKDCNHCGLCEWDCKSNCIDRVNKKVDFSRCVNCFNCFSVCNKDAVTYKMSLPWKNKDVAPVPVVSADETKRSFIAGSLVLAMGIFGFKINKVPSANPIKKDTIPHKEIIPTQDTTIPENKDFPVAPPGAGSIRKFKDTCTACHLCVSACPTHTLQPSLIQYGITGFMQPHMDYHAGFCNFECTLCMDICPAGALLPAPLEEKKLKQLGIAIFIKENCIVETDGTDCGACSEHCPTKAVDMVPYHDDLFIPLVTEDICIGCGACEYACPTKPYKAIFVNGNAEHVMAEPPPQQEKLDMEIDFEGDFPF
jgi:ferredoxin